MRARAFPGYIPKEPEKSVFRLPRKLPRIDDRKLVRINAIRTNLRSSIIGALAKPKSRFFRFFGYRFCFHLREMENSVIYLCQYMEKAFCQVYSAPSEIVNFGQRQSSLESTTALFANGRVLMQHVPVCDHRL